MSIKVLVINESNKLKELPLNKYACFSSELKESLEKLVKEVNDNIEYDFEKLKDHYKHHFDLQNGSWGNLECDKIMEELCKTSEFNEEFLEKASLILDQYKDKLYQSPEFVKEYINDHKNYLKLIIELERDYKSKVGDQKIFGKGSCGQAGEIIRSKLNELFGNKLYYGSVVTITNKRTTHDVTLVMDNEGNWAMLNSLTPFNDYTIIPKEKLSEYQFSSVNILNLDLIENASEK